MRAVPPEEVTTLLAEWAHGDSRALARLMPVVYDELHRMAERYMRYERSDHTLQTTALVHETYLRLLDQRRIDWRNRAQFFGVAAMLMRRILLRHVERKRAGKRGGGQIRVVFDETLHWTRQEAKELWALNEALDALSMLDPRQVRVVELRFFVGLKVEEVAEILEISPRTVKREWRAARAWIQREILGAAAESRPVEPRSAVS